MCLKKFKEEGEIPKRFPAFFKSKEIINGDYKSQLKQVGVNLIKAPCKLIYDIFTTSYWVVLGLVVVAILVAFLEPRIREVVVDIIIRWLTRI